MARRTFSGLISAIAKEVANAQRRAELEKSKQRQQTMTVRARTQARAAALRDAERAQATAAREAERSKTAAAREAARAQALAAKQAQQEYLAARAEEVDQMNTELQECIERLRHVGEHTLEVDDRIDLESLRIRDEFPPFTPPADLANPVKSPGFVGRLLPGAQKRQEEAEAERKRKLEQLTAQYERDKQALLLKKQQRNKDVDDLKAAYREGDPSAIVTYTSMVLERSEYPDGFPQQFQLAYVPEPKELVVEYELPAPNVVPKTLEYRYVKAKDAVEEKGRKAAELKELYQDIVAAVCLRTLHEVFESDQHSHVQVAVFNGFARTIDPSTGRDVQPHLVSVRVIRDRFIELDLRRIDKRACLRNLGAQVSPRPDEMQPVKPVVEFNMVDRRFIEQSDVLGGLDARPNLMELSPSEFENLVSNLFGKMGLETRLTRTSRDGGVDAVAFDTRPVIGGKVVIQAKRYKNTVGVSAVRDLYGTMMNEGANKGILVATSSYGPDAYDFAKDKPVELIDGGGLLYLLEQVGIRARIVFPTEG